MFGRLNNRRFPRHDGGYLLQRAKLLKTSNWIDPSGNGRLHEPPDEFMR